MIFMTVGTQLPFDRLTSAVDAWCAQAGAGIKLIGQIGQLGSESYRPSHFKWVEKVDPLAFDKHVREASMIVSHAGMGSIITAMSTGKPIIVLPRRAHLAEQRNDHQFATAQKLGTRPGVYVAMSEDELPNLIDQVLETTNSPDCGTLSPFAEDRLISAVRDFIQTPRGS